MNFAKEKEIKCFEMKSPSIPVNSEIRIFILFALPPHENEKITRQSGEGQGRVLGAPMGSAVDTIKAEYPLNAVWTSVMIRARES